MLNVSVSDMKVSLTSLISTNALKRQMIRNYISKIKDNANNKYVSKESCDQLFTSNFTK
jgi:hypothetical protein